MSGALGLDEHAWRAGSRLPAIFCPPLLITIHYKGPLLNSNLSLKYHYKIKKKKINKTEEEEKDIKNYIKEGISNVYATKHHLEVKDIYNTTIIWNHNYKENA